jgi:hypothetical protein
MFLAKLCEALETDMDGLLDSLYIIPGIIIDETRESREVTNNLIIYKHFISCVLTRNYTEYVLKLWQITDDYESNLFAEYRRDDYFSCLSKEKAESEFLAIIAKRITRTKSARN